MRWRSPDAKVRLPVGKGSLWTDLLCHQAVRLGSPLRRPPVFSGCIGSKNNGPRRSSPTRSLGNLWVVLHQKVTFVPDRDEIGAIVMRYGRTGRRRYQRASSLWRESCGRQKETKEEAVSNSRSRVTVVLWSIFTDHLFVSDCSARSSLLLHGQAEPNRPMWVLLRDHFNCGGLLLHWSARYFTSAA
jgi:hypothetical protein